MEESLLGRGVAAVASLAFALVVLVGCNVGGDVITVPALEPRKDQNDKPLFTCFDQDTTGCDRQVYLSCRPNGEFLETESLDCAAMGKVCDVERGCIVCQPGTPRCKVCDDGDEGCSPNIAQICDATGDKWNDVEECDLPAGDICPQGMCQRMCDLAQEERSYVGCKFFSADLDNAAIDDLNNASRQQYAVVVTNPQSVPVEVYVEVNEAPYGQALDVRELERRLIPPGGLEILELPRREVDGSSAEGLDDGTHTAVTSNAFRIESSHPIVAYQFNPLENVNVFSNDASLLLPTSAIGLNYTVVGWPQTIGDSENPEQDFDHTSSDEDLRAFLTILGTQEDTTLNVKFGDDVVRVVGAGIIPTSGPGDELKELKIGPFDVVNLETEGFNADFTGSVVSANKPIVVFVGSEASDVPPFGTYATRQCCAAHLEEQLFPDRTLGTLFYIARMPSRTKALKAAGFPDDPLDIAVAHEPEWVRVVAVAPGKTKIETSLPVPNHEFELDQGEHELLWIDQDVRMESSQRIAVLQALPSQGVTGIPRQFPGGDPAIIAVPPAQQFRKDYIFLTPDKYAFDFVTITAPREANILMDGRPLDEHSCEPPAPADGLERKRGDAPPDHVVYRCQFSFPMVTNGANSRTLAGRQDDGVHTLVSDQDVGIVVYGFDRFVSYAYAGGLNLKFLE